jgi:hypothetical protein
MSASQDAKNWFVLLRGKRYGPYTFAALVHAAQRGVVDRDAGVWCLGWTEWRIARNVPGLFEPEPEPDEVEEEDDASEDDADDRDEAGADDGEEEPREDEADEDESRDEERELRATRDYTERRGGARRRDDVDERSETPERGVGARGEAGDRGKPGKPAPEISPGAGSAGALGRISDLSDLRAPSRDTDPRAPGRDTDLRAQGRDGDLRAPRRDEDEPDDQSDEAPSDEVSPEPAMAASEAPAALPRAGFGASLRLAALSALATLLIIFVAAAAAAWFGFMRVEFMPAQTATKGSEKSSPAAATTPAAPPPQTNAASAAAPARNMTDGVPDIVADMPAVAALKKADPNAYAKFAKRFAAAYKANAGDDETLTQARTALRKSMKHLLATASTESLLEVTEVNLAYMRALQSASPGSCVALSDESKGATLEANLARDYAPLFQREMAVLERIIDNPGSGDPAPTEADVRPYLESVFDSLKKQPVQTQLLGRDKLTAAEYAPYCDLVIAFYEAVRALPFADAVKLLRNLYTTAAAEPEADKP